MIDFYKTYIKIEMHAIQYLNGSSAFVKRIKYVIGCDFHNFDKDYFLAPHLKKRKKKCKT